MLQTLATNEREPQDIPGPGGVTETPLPAQTMVGETLVVDSEEEEERETTGPDWVWAFLEHLGRNGLLYVDEVSDIEGLLRASSSSQEFARGFALGRQLRLRQ